MLSDAVWQQVAINAAGVIVALGTFIKLFKTDRKVDDVKQLADGNLTAMRADLKTAMERIVSLERLIAASSLPPGAAWLDRPTPSPTAPSASAPAPVTDSDVEAALDKMREDTK